MHLAASATISTRYLVARFGHQAHDLPGLADAGRMLSQATASFQARDAGRHAIDHAAGRSLDPQANMPNLADDIPPHPSRGSTPPRSQARHP